LRKYLRSRSAIRRKEASVRIQNPGVDRLNSMLEPMSQLQGGDAVIAAQVEQLCA
jgi:hypothetical protein